MDELLQQQHAQDGNAKFSPDELKATLGGLFSLLKSKGVDLHQIQAIIPQAGDLVTKAESDNASRAIPNVGGGDGAGGGHGASGLLSSALGTLGHHGGGGGSGTTGDSNSKSSPIQSMTQLLGYLGKMGIDPKQVMAFLPIVTQFLSKHGINAASILGSSGTAGASGTSAAASTSSGSHGVGNLMNQATGFMSSFGKK